ncbi:MAG: 3-hydroxyacyl-ACP dehydratase FabZ [Robiginitomaculum sp.]|nr:3-hydroxyacyl-ACP dehydratase FabZ [Robiginitomaculum sp.]
MITPVATPFGVEVIEEYLPHRRPMLMLDRVTKLDGEVIVAEIDTKPDAFYFDGHFPANPIMPGVVILECIGQTGALLAALRGDFDHKTQLLAFTSFDKTRFRKFVKPNETLCVYCELVKKRRHLYKFAGRVEVNGELVVALDFSAALTAKK